MEFIKKYLPHGLVLSFVIKMLLITPSFADVGILLPLVGLLAFYAHIEKKDEFKEIKDVVSKQNDVIAVMAGEHAKMKIVMESVTLKNQFTSGGNLKKVI